MRTQDLKEVVQTRPLATYFPLQAARSASWRAGRSKDRTRAFHHKARAILARIATLQRRAMQATATPCLRRSTCPLQTICDLEPRAIPAAQIGTRWTAALSPNNQMRPYRGLGKAPTRTPGTCHLRITATATAHRQRGPRKPTGWRMATGWAWMPASRAPPYRIPPV